MKKDRQFILKAIKKAGFRVIINRDKEYELIEDFAICYSGERIVK